MCSRDVELCVGHCFIITRLNRRMDALLELLDFDHEYQDDGEFNSKDENRRG